MMLPNPETHANVAITQTAASSALPAFKPSTVRFKGKSRAIVFAAKGKTQLKLRMESVMVQ